MAYAEHFVGFLSKMNIPARNIEIIMFHVIDDVWCAHHNIYARFEGFELWG